MTYQYISNDSTLEFHVNPKYEGGWQIGGNWTIYVLKRPTEEQIKNTEELLGWEWVETEERNGIK